MWYIILVFKSHEFDFKMLFHNHLCGWNMHIHPWKYYIIHTHTHTSPRPKFYFIEIQLEVRRWAHRAWRVFSLPPLPFPCRFLLLPSTFLRSPFSSPFLHHLWKTKKRGGRASKRRREDGFYEMKGRGIMVLSLFDLSVRLLHIAMWSFGDLLHLHIKQGQIGYLRAKMF